MSFIQRIPVTIQRTLTQRLVLSSSLRSLYTYNYNNNININRKSCLFHSQRNTISLSARNLSTETTPESTEHVPLTREQISERVLDTVKKFLEKREITKSVTEKSSFQKELALDSLDTVEVVLAVEEEFGIEIPDAEADRMQTPADAVEYILKVPDAK
jgi:NADH dehydrogenase (ubiquinone) 1 alpha/beta subcomplex 1